MRLWRVFVVVHGVLVLVVVGVVLLLVATHDRSVPDANIGAVMLAFFLGLLGLPWSIPALYDVPDRVAIVIFTAAALGNVAINEALRRRLTRPNQT